MFTSRLTMCNYVDFGLSSITLSVNLTIKLYELSVFLDTCLNTYCHGIFSSSTNWIILANRIAKHYQNACKSM